MILLHGYNARPGVGGANRKRTASLFLPSSSMHIAFILFSVLFGNDLLKFME